jgi:hypothetical protein
MELAFGIGLPPLGGNNQRLSFILKECQVCWGVFAKMKIQVALPSLRRANGEAAICFGGWSLNEGQMPP